MYLVEGQDGDEAYEKAVNFAKKECGGKFEFDGEAAFKDFMEIRKLISVRHHILDADLSSDDPRDGTELTFSYFRLGGEPDLVDLVNGESVQVVYAADPRPD